MNTTSSSFPVSSFPGPEALEDSDRQEMPRTPRRALVIGGGGAAGNAWALGLIAGLAEAGLDVTESDLIVGTSSGSTVAAQITSGAGLAQLYEATQAPIPPQHRAGTRHGHGPGPKVSGAGYLDWSQQLIDSSKDPGEMRRRLGAAALERDGSGGADAEQWRTVVASRLPGAHWPPQRVLIPAVDAFTGEPVVFDRDSGVDIVDAVAASTSAMVPYRIGERRYLNGGYRRSENADLAAGYERVLVLVPFGGRSRMPEAWGMDLATQLLELREAGSRAEAVFPDAGAGEVFDANALDPSTRRQAGRGGYEQGMAIAADLGDLWR
ncbi:patatin-like phospholipase family protein [Arthrobacter sp. NPDC090010]|uniref:patatin-like phospholipase family protein n=1 Tax=Arthrobacter sp. NPDC090010 TaxID=3363942 RepID=UPI00382ACD31